MEGKRFSVKYQKAIALDARQMYCVSFGSLSQFELSPVMGYS